MNIDTSYQVFQIPKSNGKKRTIEAPSKSLKAVQHRLLHELQYHYFHQLPECVHGYVSNIDGASPRNVRTNALIHIGAIHLYNVDLKDFFHQITTNRLPSALAPFLEPLSVHEIDRIAQVTMLHGRLPMGAPSSPVLSNMAFYPADRALQDFASNHQLRYTRYVDDLSFSSQVTISKELQEEIKDIITQYGFEVNAKKVTYYGSQDTKVVTGVEIDQLSLRVSDKMFRKIHKNIDGLKKIERLADRLRFLDVDTSKLQKQKLKTVKRAIKGQLEFVKHIEGKDSKHYRDLKQRYKQKPRLSDDLDLSVYF